MVKEAEEFADEDRAVKERIDARNSLETYAYNMKSQIGDADKLADKLDKADKAKVEAAVKEALEWLDENQSADKEEYEEKLKEARSREAQNKTAPKEGGGLWKGMGASARLRQRLTRPLPPPRSPRLSPG